jgi:DNA-directed RNA polymerase subunit RPC12/RpoP
MGRTLRVIKNEEGEPAVECPRCGETVQPTYYQLFDGYECPECSQAIDPDVLKRYLKAMRDFEEYGE